MIVPCAVFAGAAATWGRRHWNHPAGFAPCFVLLAVLATLTWRQSRMYADAETLYRTTIDRNPNCWLAHNNLGEVLTHRGRFGEAQVQFQKAVDIRPYMIDLNNLAWSLATSPEASLRNGAKAVETARRAMELSDGRQPAILDTLAAAYAEAGRFPEAVETVRKAIALASEQKQPDVEESLREKIAIYEAGKPFRETPQAAAAARH